MWNDSGCLVDVLPVGPALDGVEVAVNVIIPGCSPRGTGISPDDNGWHLTPVKDPNSERLGVGNGHSEQA